VQAAKGGQVQFRVERAGVVHAGVGKASFNEDQISGNIRAFVDAINRAKPAGAKGTYLKKVAISTTMGPGIRLDVSDFRSTEAAAS
jgi:large subunit ribosomal protein L1